MAVKGAVAYEAYAAAEHVGGYFRGGVVVYLLGPGDGGDEAVHVGVAHGERLAGQAAVDVAVLQRGGAHDYGVEGRARCVDEDEVGNEGHVAALTAVSGGDDYGFHGCEDFKSGLMEHLIGGELCVAALEVAHREPLFGGLSHELWQ